MQLNRRVFLASLAAAVTTTHLLAQNEASQTHPDVATIDRERILAAAERALKLPPSPLTSVPLLSLGTTPNDFQILLEPANSPALPQLHRAALNSLANIIPALAAAFVLTKQEQYADHAALHLRAWFVDPATAMTPNLAHAQATVSAPDGSSPKSGDPAAIYETTRLAEVAVAIPFLTRSEAFTAADFTATKLWFSTFLDWLSESRQAGLARDTKSHLASSWLLQSAAYARLSERDPILSALRHRFKTSTLRSQISSDGSFPAEIRSDAPYRNSLLNLDLLAGTCQLLSGASGYGSLATDNLWNYELQDGPGMRSVIAFHYPFMLDRGRWPYKSDLANFNALPARHPALLFSGRVYARPEYIALWKRLNADPTNPAVLGAFPIRQPLLWISRS